jgi:hypothetical protein
LGTLPINTDHRVIGFTRISIGRRSLFAFGWFSAIASLHTLAVLGIANFSLVNPKTIQRDGVLGILSHVVPAVANAVVFFTKSDGIINLASCAAHPESAPWHSDHRHPVGGARPGVAWRCCSRW